MPDESAQPRESPADRLRGARAAAGYATPSDAARAFSWTLTTYRSHENGHRGYPLKAAQRYAKAFGVSPMWLMTGEDDAAPPDDGASAHTVLIHSAAVREIERMIAQAGPINAAPRDLARRILVDVLGFWIEESGEPR